MCRLILSCNGKMYNELDLFIKASTMDASVKRLDGYGIVWQKKNIVNSYVSSVAHFYDNRYIKIIQEIMSDRPEMIMAHVRKKSDKIINLIENNQPFFLKKERTIFVHNGIIKDFSNHKSFILSNIHDIYKTEIKGSTDSELIMFLYLTYIRKNNAITDIRKNMMKSMNEVFDFFETNKISIVANIICTIDDNIIICRYSVRPWNKNSHPLLYIYEKNDKIFVSTQKMLSNQILIKRNSILMRTR